MERLAFLLAKIVSSLGVISIPVGVGVLVAVILGALDVPVYILLSAGVLVAVTLGAFFALVSLTRGRTFYDREIPSPAPSVEDADLGSLEESRLPGERTFYDREIQPSPAPSVEDADLGSLEESRLPGEPPLTRLDAEVGIGVQPGSILWNPPDRMKVGRTEAIEVRMGDATVVEAALREGLRGRGTPNIDRLELAPTMRVSLVSNAEDFSIQELNSKDQYVRPGRVARWDFGVTPLRSGNRRLRLLASIRIKVEGKDEVVDLPSFEREVRVIVAPVRVVSRFFRKNWQWVAGTVAIPLVAWAVKNTDAGKVALRHIRDLLP
jgi:hypothetical protein